MVSKWIQYLFCSYARGHTWKKRRKSRILKRRWGRGWIWGGIVFAHALSFPWFRQLHQAKGWHLKKPVTFFFLTFSVLKNTPGKITIKETDKESGRWIIIIQHKILWYVDHFLLGWKWLYTVDVDLCVSILTRLLAAIHHLCSIRNLLLVREDPPHSAHYWSLPVVFLVWLLGLSDEK